MDLEEVFNEIRNVFFFYEKRIDLTLVVNGRPGSLLTVYVLQLQVC